jgi:hypothetical protein
MKINKFVAELVSRCSALDIQVLLGACEGGPEKK